MKPGITHLLATLRGQPVAEPDWPNVLPLAAAEHLLPWFLHRTRLSSIPLPAPVEATLREAERDFAHAAFFWSAELAGLLHAFRDAALPVLPLKGPFLAHRLYGSVALRASRDLDLLVERKHRAAAHQLLCSLGFTPAAFPDDYHHSFLRNSTLVELHFDVENPLAFDFKTGKAFHHAVTATFASQPIQHLSPADELLYLCLHGVRHRFERLSYVLDIALALERLPGHPQRPELRPLTPLLQLGTALAHKLNPNLPRPAVPPHLQALADRCWHTLLTRPEAALDWQALHRFYLDLEPTVFHRLARHLRHTRILATRTIEADYLYAANLGFHRPWQATILRPLRLLTAKRGRDDEKPS